MALPKKVFREYDIRGVADRDLDNDGVRDLGRALGTFWVRRGAKRCAIGRDCRLSSPRLFEALTTGLRECDLELVDLGVVPTPLMYFSVFQFDLDGGVQITGSHNPPEDNGFKIMLGKDTLSGADVQELYALIASRDFETKGTRGRIAFRDPLPAYVGFVKGNIRVERTDLRFAIDAGNGAGGPTAVAAMRAIGLSPIALLTEMDGAFPVHHPDPTMPENLALLRETIAKEKLAFGIAYDGDADRLGVIDEKGDVLWGDRLLALFARDVLSRRPGARILGEVKCSQTLYDDIAAHGGEPILWKTGHSLIKKKMKESGALLAGEMSGHVFFADRFFGFDDAVYASLRLIEILARTEAPLSSLLSDIPETFSTPELRVDCPDETKFEVVDRVRAQFRKTHEVIDVDGARIQFGQGAWGLVRASNTQPVLVLRFEAGTEARLAEIRREVERAVEDARSENAS